MSAGGRKGVCEKCHLVQSIITDDWKKTCHEIYTNYTVYYQSGGNEQAVFSPGSAQGTARSQKILAETRCTLHLPSRGKALDVGCGNGNFLKALSSAYPDWRLSGCEYNDIYRQDVLAIRGVEAFHAGGIGGITGSFDFISLIHVLEHMENPIRFLRDVTSLLSGQGVLLIEVPFFVDNPFELLIADHASHFDENSMIGILWAAGLEVRSISTRAVSKEMTVVAARRDEEAPSSPPLCEMEKALEHSIASLLKFRDRAKNVRQYAEMLAVFGTSIGGTWLCSELNNKIDFFVDEDPQRIGRTHMGKPILAFGDFSAETSLCIPLARCSARPLIERLPSLKLPPLIF
jgi:SAM-dependent methyltransferase